MTGIGVLVGRTVGVSSPTGVGVSSPPGVSVGSTVGVSVAVGVAVGSTTLTTASLQMVSSDSPSGLLEPGGFDESLRVADDHELIHRLVFRHGYAQLNERMVVLRRKRGFTGIFGLSARTRRKFSKK